jgi:hypothetical protein
MSLLNDVLRDLQTRGVFGVPPLAGLQPVTDVPAHHRRRALLLPVLGGVFVASTIVLWQPVSNGTLVPSIARMFDGTPAQPQIEIQADSLRTAPIEPAPVAATGDDLRELFGVDNTIASRAPAVTEFTAEPVTDVPPVTTASRIETVVADLSPQAASDDTSAASPSTASMAAIESQPSNEPATVVDEPDSDDVDGLVARGVKSMRANDPFTAESMFRAALLVESGDAETWGYLYSVLNKTSRPEAAEKALQQGLVAADEPAPLAKLYARMLLDLGCIRPRIRFLPRRLVAATRAIRRRWRDLRNSADCRPGFGCHMDRSCDVSRQSRQSRRCVKRIRARPHYGFTKASARQVRTEA